MADEAQARQITKDLVKRTICATIDPFLELHGDCVSLSIAFESPNLRADDVSNKFLGRWPMMR